MTLDQLAEQIRIEHHALLHARFESRRLARASNRMKQTAGSETDAPKDGEIHQISPNYYRNSVILEGCVYFIQSDHGGPIKIGFTGNREQRLKTLQLSSPYKLVVLGLIPNSTYETEKKLHEKFSEFRLHGEWFSPDEKILAYIAEVSKS
jgi:hypothetical protein